MAEALSISYRCDLLKSLSLCIFPKLHSLFFSGCLNLETLLIPDDDLQNLMELKIGNCSKMISFPHGGLPTLNLTSFRIENCKKLKSLPQKMHTLLPSLQELEIVSCPEIESFPDGGLPSNLCELCIRNCEKLMKGRMGWGFQTLPSLGDFTISGGYEDEEVVESFPEEWLLPTTLIFLEITNLPNLKSLNHKGIQHLTSLKTLYIWNFHKLQSLPEEGLPSSLCYLSISYCPLLKPRCQRDKGEDWPNIIRIPHIRIHGEYTVNLE